MVSFRIDEDDFKRPPAGPPRRNHQTPGTQVSASAFLAIAIVMIMLLGIFVFALRLV